MKQIKDSEKDIEPALKRAVDRLGGMCMKLRAIAFTGWPDRTILLPGGFIIFVELKSTGKTLRKRQLFVRNQLVKLGFRYEVIDTFDKLNEFILTL